MKNRLGLVLLSLVVLPAAPALATIFGNVRGVVHDPQHRPVAAARVTLAAQGSAWTQTTESNAEGEFEFAAVPVGDYVVKVQAAGFGLLEERISVTSGSAPVFHLQLVLASQKETVEVSGAPGMVSTESATTETLVTRRQVFHTPGADRTNSLALITDFLPGATYVHDQLHVRGGHQVSWAIDGVPIPNTNIASNVGPQFDPKDVDSIEMKTGGYAAEYGDRTYGVFNVIPRTGFEYSNQGELTASYGSFDQSNDQLSFGNHTERLAYYGSINANRSDLGLLTPASPVIHDLASGVGGFGDLIFNATPSDQLRLVGSVRADHYQIPNTSEDQAAGTRDLDIERDDIFSFSWVHTFSPGALLAVSPFYHFNRAHFIGGPNDQPVTTDDNRSSRYEGGEATLALVEGAHNAQFGVEAFAQQDSTLFSLQANDGSGLSLNQRVQPSGQLEAAFAQDQYRAASWLSLTGGVRLTHFGGLLNENAADPRVGLVVRIPHLHWILRGSYSRYYQAPPLDTVSGPLEQLAVNQGFGFLPLRGERDEQQDFGLTIPVRQWFVDVGNFRTHAHNFFDHDVLGNSNIFLPLTIQSARLRGWEATVRSPEIAHRARIRLVYSYQYAQASGAVTGGLTDFSPPDEGFFFLDHDQRHTAQGVFSFTLPRRAWATAAVSYGSGFLNGDGPAHLPGHTTFDLALGKDFGENWSVSVNSTNVGNSRYLIDNSNTFGGTHFANPREVYGQFRYRFHF